MAFKKIARLSSLRWVNLNIPHAELNIDISLQMGQCFNWKIIDTGTNGKVYIGHVPGISCSPVALKRTDESTFFALIAEAAVDAEPHSSGRGVKRESKKKSSGPSDVEAVNLMKSYFQMDYSLSECYGQWSENCPRMKVIAAHLVGARVCRQDPWECLISFICSSNNNIKRITQILERFRTSFGQYMCTFVMDDPNPNGATEFGSGAEFAMYSFPTIDALLAQDPASPVASVARDFTTAFLQEHIGLGYRAKFIHNTVHQLAALGGSTTPASTGANAWFESIRRAPLAEWGGTGVDGQATRRRAQDELARLPGVGRKVADCVALFCLDHADVVPVDVHVYNIAVRDYMRDSPADGDSLVLTLDARLYARIGDTFRAKFGPYAGFAHSLLFAAELPQFADSLPVDVVLQMRDFKVAKAAELKQLKQVKADARKRKHEGTT